MCVADWLSHHSFDASGLQCTFWHRYETWLVLLFIYGTYSMFSPINFVPFAWPVGPCKYPHPLVATVFTVGGWNLTWRTSVCVKVAPPQSDSLHPPVTLTPAEGLLIKGEGPDTFGTPCLTKTGTFPCPVIHIFTYLQKYFFWKDWSWAKGQMINCLCPLVKKKLLQWFCTHTGCLLDCSYDIIFQI